MNNDIQEQERYLRARARVHQLRGFYIHVGVFVVVNLYLLVINLVTNAQSLWFYWPLLAWSVGLAVHALIVFGAGHAIGADWEQRKIREFMERDAQSAAMSGQARRRS